MEGHELIESCVLLHLIFGLDELAEKLYGPQQTKW